MTLPDPPLLVVTDQSQAARPLPELLNATFSAGCRWASLREKDLPGAAQVALARILLPVARLWGARLTLHGDPYFAQSAGVDGVHLAARGNCIAARSIVGPRAMIGLSIHSIGETAHLNGADYAIAGPVFATESKPGYGPPLGAAGLSAIVKASSVPVIAIGGITADTVPEVMASGAKGIAVMGGVMRAANPKAEVWELVAALKVSHV